MGLVMNPDPPCQGSTRTGGTIRNGMAMIKKRCLFRSSVYKELCAFSYFEHAQQCRQPPAEGSAQTFGTPACTCQLALRKQIGLNS